MLLDSFVRGAKVRGTVAAKRKNGVRVTIANKVKLKGFSAKTIGFRAAPQPGSKGAAKMRRTEPPVEPIIIDTRTEVSSYLHLDRNSLATTTCNWDYYDRDQP